MANRILTTHVGSLVRPPAVVNYIDAIENGVAVDQKAFDACLHEEIAKVIRQQAERASTSSATASSASCAAGRSTCWTASRASRSAPSRARGAGRDRRCSRNSMPSISRPRSCPTRHGGRRRGPIKYKGQAAVARDIEDVQGRAEGLRREGRGRIPAGGRARERGAGATRTSTTRTTRSSCSRSRRRCARNTRRSSMPASPCRSTMPFLPSHVRRRLAARHGSRTVIASGRRCASTP